MFVCSVKTSKKKLILFGAAALLLIAAVVLLTLRGGAAPAQESAVNYSAKDAQERIAFISQFGWRIAPDPVEVSEVILPEVYDTAYTEYVELNRAQGLDLDLYRGARVKRWTYDILNYPGFEERSGAVQINLLICGGRVVGGDVCSLEQGGFLRGFAG